MKKFTIKTIEISNNNQSVNLHSNDDYLFMCFNSTGYYTYQKETKLFALNDLILLKPNESVSIKAFNSKSELTITIVRIPLDTLTAFSDNNTNLKASFEFVPYNIAVINAQNERASLMKNILNKIMHNRDEELIGNSILNNGFFASFLILFLRECVSNDYVHRYNKRNKLAIDDVFNYITHHLNEDLSLNKLSKVFYISKEHLIREFKKQSGLTLHQSARIPESVFSPIPEISRMLPACGIS